MNAPLPIQLKIMNPRLGEEFEMPKYQTLGAAGFDLAYIPHRPDKVTMTLPPNGLMLLHTGVAVHIKDPNYVGLLVARSSLHKRRLMLANNIGIIDADYQGELMLKVWNFGKFPTVIDAGERIAQLLIVPVQSALFQIVNDFDDESERGAGGFGSTGT